MLCYAMLSHTMLYYAMLCYDMLHYYTMLCYDMLNYTIFSLNVFGHKISMQLHITKCFTGTNKKKPAQNTVSSLLYSSICDPEKPQQVFFHTFFTFPIFLLYQFCCAAQV